MALIYTGTNPTRPVNFYADNSTLIPLGVGVLILPTPVVTEPSGIAIYTSNQPVLISEDDFDLLGTRGISNKLFMHFNYARPDMKDSKWTPYVGVGAEVEFGGGSNGCCNDECETACSPCNYNYNPNPVANVCSTLKPCCTNVALTQWGVWFKIGTSYN